MSAGAAQPCWDPWDGMAVLPSALGVVQQQSWGNWGEFRGDATSKPPGKLLCVEVGGVSRGAAEGEEELPLEMPVSVLAQGLVTPSVRNSEILLLPSAGNGQGRSELSDCCFQPTGQDPPITSWSPVSRLKCWRERLESEMGCV